MGKNIENDPEQLIRGFKDMFYKLYGVMPRVSYTLESKAQKLKISEVWKTTESVLAADMTVPAFIKTDALKKGVNFAVRCYRYSFIKNCVDLGHSPAEIAVFLRISASSINYACKAIDLSYRLDDTKSQNMRNIYSNVTMAILNNTHGDSE